MDMEEEVESPHESPKERLRILVIDDSLVIRAMIEEMAEAEGDGCKVVGTASNIPAARDMIRDLLPNVITLDLNMPGIGGIDFLDELRDDKHPPVIVVSSASCDASAVSQDAIDHGASACFDKAKLVSERERFFDMLQDAVRQQHEAARQAAVKKEAAEQEEEGAEIGEAAALSQKDDIADSAE